MSKRRMPKYTKTPHHRKIVLHLNTSRKPSALDQKSELLLKADSFGQQPNRPTTSKVAYFKRKYAEEEDLHRDFHEYFQQHLILPEDRHCILRLSLEKLRFLEDPEVYLRRSVLINNLLRKLHREEGRAEQGGAGPCTWDSERQHYPEAKRLKAVVADCCSQVFAYGEVPRYHVVPGCLYGHPADCNAQVLIYKLGDDG